ncbi:DUF5063 domain-containing protein [Marinifilum caeruleilacunae]|uniref:DUF5063 domain-containing protein n=1 Tax=Marinifilum caeruleilacunae TaxID=2499076 RepID=A0ABX1X2K8_9BACT|nr:DUF5063 domain-containing protein [Marinifilum caeruleilacunae]NOU62329.1 DUF5063 domain-containing protein [Marinifilum caeruleilacunae]
MKNLVQIIDGIAKYGLQTDLQIENKEKDLEQYLVDLYSQSFIIKFEFDNRDYPEFDKSQFPNVINNVRSNFGDFGFYHSVLNSTEILKDAETATGDAVDDLSDIIYDVLEIKWRIENNSVADGLWYFKLIFNGHTQQHLIDLLNFMKAKNG